jgi:hypothetical protein
MIVKEVTPGVEEGIGARRWNRVDEENCSRSSY